MTYDVLIFGGQSNMQGQTGSLPEPNDPVDGAYEYKFLTDTLEPLCHPSGETIEEYLLLHADGCGGSLVPDFCRTYVNESGRNAVAIHAAKGATTIAEWLPGTARYDCALKKIRGGIEKASEMGDIGKIYYIWLQGESDAIIHTTEDEYARMMIEYKDALKKDTGIDKFGIIEVGYFYGVISWGGDRPREERMADDEAIMRAQERLPAEDKDFVILTDVCKKLSLMPEMLNPNAEGHYGNEAMTIIGSEAAKTLTKI